MRTSFLTVLLYLSFLIIGEESYALPLSRVRTNQILESTLESWRKISSLHYQLRRELNYPSENYFHTLEAEAYLQFTPTVNGYTAIFQFENNTSSLVFNGSELFVLNKANKTVSISKTPPLHELASLSFLYNSPLTLWNALPVFISDDSISKSIRDTTIQSTAYYVIDFILRKKRLGNLGNIESMTANIQIGYSLMIHSKTLLPYEVIQHNSKSGDFIKTTFHQIVANASKPAEKSWYYSTYVPDYKIIETTTANAVPLLENGQVAPNWQLPIHGSSQILTLQQYRGKLVLLEFWICHCGFCIASVPKLNAIHKKYKDKPVQLLAINPYDNSEVIDDFQKRNRPIYPILTQGNAIAYKYGISAYPMVVLLDKKGVVLYAGHFDQQQIEALIDKHL